MEPQIDSFESTNINALWLNNIYENLKNLESLHRLAREGCNSIMEYLQIPYDQRLAMLGDIQYKNLRFILTETVLLLEDLSPVINETQYSKFIGQLKQLKKVINQRNLFIRDIYSASENKIINSKLTNFFFETLEYLGEVKVAMIKIPDVSAILYVKSSRGGGFSKS